MAGVIAGVVVVILVIVAGSFVAIRNTIIRTRNRVDESWSGIDVQLRRRHDLIPNLVETVKGYAAHERGVLESLTQMRAEAVRAQGPGQTAKAEGQLSGALASVQAVAENYPQLRASENFVTLQRELDEVEDQIQAARRIYNSNVQAFNSKIQVFPNSVVARAGGFTARTYFEIEPAERDPVAVSFN